MRGMLILGKFLNVLLLLGAVVVIGAAAQASDSDTFGTCDPGHVMDLLVVNKNLSLTGADAQEMAGLYDAFFKIMRQCKNTGNLEFTVKLDWDDGFIAWLAGVPPLPDYTYNQRLSVNGELCLSRKGMEATLASAVPWYCEKAGWVDKLKA